MMTQENARKLLAYNGHDALLPACPLLIVTENSYTLNGKVGTEVTILPCDRGVLRAWMGY